jgi:hypothetical protein
MGVKSMAQSGGIDKGRRQDMLPDRPFGLFDGSKLNHLY